MSDIFTRLRAARSAESANARATDAARYPLTDAQRRIQAFDELFPRSAAYHVPLALRFERGLDAAALAAAFDELLLRHDALRSRLVRGAEGHVFELGARIELSRIDGRSWDAAATTANLRALAREPFVPEAGLVRAALIELAGGAHLLLLVAHHLVIDGSSVEIVIEELGALYEARVAGRAAALPAAPSFAAHAHAHAAAPAGAASAPGADDVMLPYDRQPSDARSAAGDQVRFALDEIAPERVAALAASLRATPFAVACAAFLAVLRRYARGDAIRSGVAMHGRGPDTVRAVGLFAGVRALRTPIAPATSFARLVELVREGTVANTELDGDAFALTSFVYLNLPRADAAFRSLAVERVSVTTATAQNELTLVLEDGGTSYTGYVEYRSDVFERATIERFVGHYRTLLADALAAPQRAVGALQLLSAGEQAQLAGFNRTGFDYPERELLAHELIAAHARRRPEVAAAIGADLSGREEQLSFAALESRANQLARALRAAGVGAETPVAILLEPGTAYVVAVLAVLKAGGAYVPLDPTHPAERLAYALGDTRAPLAITRAGLAELVAPPARALCLDADAAALGALPDGPLEPLVRTPDALAYIIYTSGSTGRPKGVMCPHRGLVNLVADIRARRAIAPGDRCTAWHNLTFDMAVYELFTALCEGGTLDIVPAEVRLSPEAYFAWLRARDVRAACCPPFMIPALAQSAARGDGPTGLIRMDVGAEPLDDAHLRAIAAGLGNLTLINAYGPTEATVQCTAGAIEELRPRAGAASIGRPIRNARVYVLDGSLAPCPVGVVGELLVGGVAVTRGYLGRPRATAESFLPDPFADAPGARMYRTGDLARWTAEGELIFIGRTDDQIKVRGVRIEPGEIEFALREIAGVSDAAVVKVGDALVAFVATASADAALESFPAQLVTRLPSAMLPARILRLDALPLTSSGKTDRALLQQLALAAPAAAAAGTPLEPEDREMAALWEELLEAPVTSSDANLFALGGHSLHAMRLVAGVRKRYGVAITMRTVFDAPFLGAFRRAVDQARAAGAR